MNKINKLKLFYFARAVIAIIILTQLSQPKSEYKPLKIEKLRAQ